MTLVGGVRRDRRTTRQGAEWGSPLLVDRVVRAELLRLRRGRPAAGAGTTAGRQTRSSSQGGR
jgi:hypothetical protein